jgi:acyl-CoA synthetase (NDP forming)/RimJ/RimL family protein N-acetyltransferase
MAFDLTRMLKPRRIALIGASADPESIGGIVARHVLAPESQTTNLAGVANTSACQIFLVNPHHDSLYGLPCVRSVAELPAAIDLAVVLTPWVNTPAVLSALAECDVAGVVCVSIATDRRITGVIWQSHQRLLSKLRAQLQRLRLGFIGPSSFGLQLPQVALNASLAPLMPRAGGVVLISYAEALSTLVGEYCLSHDLGVRALVSLGDAVDINAAELLDFFAHDADTTVVLLHLNSAACAADLRSELLSSLRACAQRRRVFVYAPELSNTDLGNDWPQSLQGTGAFYLSSSEALCAAAQLSQFDTWHRASNASLVIAGNSVSLLSLTENAAVSAGFALAPLSSTQIKKLKAPKANIHNPLNLGRDASASAFAKATTGLADATLLLCHHPNSFARGEQIATEIIAEAHAANQHSARIAVFLGQANSAARTLLRQNAIPSFDQPALALSSLRLWLDSHPGANVATAALAQSSGLEQTVLSAGGLCMRLRDIQAQDEAALQRGFLRLSPEEVRMRFMYPLKALTHELAARLTRLDPQREIALVLAERTPPGVAQLFGVARASRSPSYRHRPRTDAEFAIVIPKALSGQGFGLRLMQALIARCQGIGIRTLWGDVLAENGAMLALAKKLGFALEKHPDEGHLVRVSLAV